jgi:hypothetical protein
MSGDLHAQNQHDAAKEAQPILQPENLHDRAADPAEKTKADTSGDWQPQDLHDRAAAAAKETRSTIIKPLLQSVGCSLSRLKSSKPDWSGKNSWPFSQRSFAWFFR